MTVTIFGIFIHVFSYTFSKECYVFSTPLLSTPYVDFIGLKDQSLPFALFTVPLKRKVLILGSTKYLSHLGEQLLEYLIKWNTDIQLNHLDRF